MEIFFYRGASPNFGDELNTWLWPRLLGEVFDGAGDLFVGIGSNIVRGFAATRRKIIFGAGYGGYTALPELDHTWSFYFVRGKLTARALGLDEAFGIGDAGIYVRSCQIPRQRIEGGVAFIPHWESVWPGRWDEVCRLAGLHFIDPTNPVESVLSEIASSDYVITEAMHGAIIADALRVPWIAARPKRAHRMKWHDWASALGMEIDWARLPRSSLLEIAQQHAPAGSGLARTLACRRRVTTLLRDHTPHWLLQRTAEHLRAVSTSVEPRLSRDAAIESVHSRMLDQLHRFVRKEGVGRVLV